MRTLNHKIKGITNQDKLKSLDPDTIKQCMTKFNSYEVLETFNPPIPMTGTVEIVKMTSSADKTREEK